MAGLNNVNNLPLVTDLGGLFLSTTGGRVLFVGTTAMVTQLGQVGASIAGSTYTTVNAALASGQLASGRGDIVYLLPGYTETIAAADQWSGLGTLTDISIIGMGHNANRPTLTWSTAGSTVLMDSANFSLSNLILQLEPTTGSVNVAAPISVTANGCSITKCRINCGTDANNKVTIGVTVTSANDFIFDNNKVRGAALATCTTFLRLDGCANPEVTNNNIVAGTTAAAVGPVQELNNACTGILIDGNTIHNNAANSTACITMALANTTGTISRNFCRNMTDASNAQIVVTSGDVQTFENRGVNNSNENGIKIGTDSA